MDRDSMRRGASRDCNEQLWEGCGYVCQEVYTGIKQSVMSTLNWLIHPRDSLQNLYHVFRHPVETARRAGQQMVEQPLVFATTVAVSVATAGLIAGALGGGSAIASSHTGYGMSAAVAHGSYTLTNGVVNGLSITTGLGIEAQRSLQSKGGELYRPTAAQFKSQFFSKQMSEKHQKARDKATPKSERVSWGI